jgi:hypothetical protein
MKRDYYDVVIMIAKELLTSIPLEPLLNKYVGVKKTSSCGLAVNHSYFSRKLDCLLNILALTSYCSNNKEGKEERSSTSFSSSDLTSCLSSYDINQLTFTKAVVKVPVDKDNFFDQMKEGFSLSSSSSISSSLSLSAKTSSSSPAPSSVENNRAPTEPASRPATIIFCNMKLTVLVLHHLIYELSMKWKISITSSSDEFPLQSQWISGDMNVTNQRHVLKDLKDGKINLLFATDVAQEGIDISQCNVIINYDGPKTLIGFIQRRGRARSLSSLLIHLVSSLHENNDIEMKDIFNFLKQEDETNQVLKLFLNEWEDDSNQETKNELSKQFRFVVKETDAYVDYIKAITLLQEFCDYFIQLEEKKKRKLMVGNGLEVCSSSFSALTIAEVENSFSSSDFEVSFPMYFFEKSKICTLIMPPAFCRKYPDCIPFSIKSDNKKIAKGLVALEAIKYLYNKGELDNHLRFRQSITCTASDKLFDDLGSTLSSTSSSTTVNMVKLEMKRCSDIITIKPIQETEVDDLIDLYFYGFEVNINFNENVLKMKLWSQLQALKRICYAFHFPLSETLVASGCSFDFFMKFSNDQLKELRTTCNKSGEEMEEMEQLLKSSLKLVFLGKKQVSKKELSLIQLFHKSIYGLHPLSFDSLTASSVTNGALLTAESLERCVPQFLSKSSDGEIPLFYDFDEWKSSVDSSHFFVLPLPQSLSSVDSAASVLSLITADYLKDCVKDSILLLKNLSSIQYNNYHNLDNYFFREDASSVVDSSLLYTNNGKHLLCFERNSSRNDKKFTDSMHDEKEEDQKQDGGQQLSKKKQKKTFYEHYQKKATSRNDPMLQAFVESLATQQNPPYFLTKGYPLSAKMEGYSLFAKKCETGNNLNKIDFAVGAEIDLIPEFCHPVGSLLFFEMSLLLPALTHRMQSLLLANELRQKITCSLETDHKINVYDILGGILPTRSLETMNSER